MQPRREPLLVETFVAQAAIEGFNAGILVRLTRLDQPELHALLMRPGGHHLDAELLAVVGPDHLRQAAAEREAVQDGVRICPEIVRSTSIATASWVVSSTMVRHLINRRSAV